MEKVIIVNREAWGTRVAILENGILQDLYFDRKNQPGIEKSFIKGKVVNVLPGIQTVFAEIGSRKSGFLHISEVDRSLAMKNIFKPGDIDIDPDESIPRKKSKERSSIGDFFKLNEEVLVQVKKEPVSEKGAKLTTCYTMPGKFLVLMPNIDSIGVSSKIESRAERSRLKELMRRLLPEGMGAVVRTDAENRSEEELEHDLEFLKMEWNDILTKYKNAAVGDVLHSDLPLAVRMMREHIGEDESVSVYCDHPSDVEDINTFLQKMRLKNQINLFLQVREDLFGKFNINKQIDALLEKKVHLKSGGNIVIEHTEAMTVIDVNSAKFVGKGNQEETTLKINLEAAKEVVRQLRLRNIGGIIIIDFIDMFSAANRRSLMNTLQEELKSADKLRSMTLKISELGLIQMTRKRSGKSLEQELMRECCECGGNGVKKSDDTLASEVLRSIKLNLVSSDNGLGRLDVSVSERIFDFLTKHEFKSILYLEKVYGIKILLAKNKQFKDAKHRIVFSANK